jgi:hypothetical protein
MIATSAVSAPAPIEPQRKGIKDVFYETRVLMGRDYTLQRFAAEALGGAIEPVTLGAIEKGKRFPNEALVRRLAALRREDPQTLLVLLWRDRMLHAFGKELRRVLRAPKALGDIADADLAVLVSQAVAALPDEGVWLPINEWRRRFRVGTRRRGKRATVPKTLAARVEGVLRQRGLIEVRGARIRRRGYHFVARSIAERQALALEFCALFAKGLLDKLALSEEETGTYLRNHYLHVDPDRVAEFERRLDDALTQLADEFAIDASARTRFLNILVTATPF